MSMETLTGHGQVSRIEQFLDDYLKVQDVPVDPAFSRFVPMVYDSIGFAWRDVFEPGFVQRFNGLMIRGHDTIGKIWCVAFPSQAVLVAILGRAQPGDLIFSHHPIDMRCGDPRGKSGVGFIPIEPQTLQRLAEHQLSFYSCHVPLDIHPQISTSDAIVRVIGGRVIDQFLPYGPSHAGRLCEIPPTSVEELVETCRKALALPYVDLQGNATKPEVMRIAVVAGGGGDVDFYEEADRLGADCLIAGEVTSKIDNDLGRHKQAEIDAYLPGTELVAIGLSHAGSEFLVMQELAPFLEHQLGISAEAVPESCWWR
jgi:putative NIF3 family GTP cyclohydrolase 1 type 2